jgi:hypothetical protein
VTLVLSPDEREVVRDALASYIDTLQTMENAAQKLARGELARRSKLMRQRAAELHIRFLRESKDQR